MKRNVMALLAVLWFFIFLPSCGGDSDNSLIEENDDQVQVNVMANLPFYNLPPGWTVEKVDSTTQMFRNVKIAVSQDNTPYILYIEPGEETYSYYVKIAHKDVLGEWVIDTLPDLFYKALYGTIDFTINSNSLFVVGYPYGSEMDLFLYVKNLQDTVWDKMLITKSLYETGYNPMTFAAQDDKVYISYITSDSKGVFVTYDNGELTLPESAPDIIHQQHYLPIVADSYGNVHMFTPVNDNLNEYIYSPGSQSWMTITVYDDASNSVYKEFGAAIDNNDNILLSYYLNNVKVFFKNAATETWELSVIVNYVSYGNQCAAISPNGRQYVLGCDYDEKTLFLIERADENSEWSGFRFFKSAENSMQTYDLAVSNGYVYVATNNLYANSLYVIYKQEK